MTSYNAGNSQYQRALMIESQASSSLLPNISRRGQALSQQTGEAPIIPILQITEDRQSSNQGNVASA